MEHYASVRATKLNQNQKKNDLNQMSRSTNEEPLSDQNTEISDTGTENHKIKTYSIDEILNSTVIVRQAFGVDPMFVLVSLIAVFPPCWAFGPEI